MKLNKTQAEIMATLARKRRYSIETGGGRKPWTGGRIVPLWYS